MGCWDLLLRLRALLLRPARFAFALRRSASKGDGSFDKFGLDVQPTAVREGSSLLPGVPPTGRPFGRRNRRMERPAGAGRSQASAASKTSRACLRPNCGEVLALKHAKIKRRFAVLAGDDFRSVGS